MNILLGYGFAAYTTGRYFEASLSKQHHVTFVGTAGIERPGYPPDIDLLALYNDLPIKPDLFLYIDSGHRSYLPFNLHKLPCPTAAYLIDVHIGSKLRLPVAEFFDYVFVAQKNETEAYKRARTQYVAWLPLACDPTTTNDQLKVDDPIYDIGFVGNVPPGSERERLLNMMATHFQINDYHQYYPPEEISSIYANSKIVFNHSILNDINMRVFESMACGSMLVAQHLNNGLEDLFTDGEQLITYRTDEELVKKITYYLENEEEREKIAAAGLEAVINFHTYDHRCQTIINTIFAEAPGCSSPLRKKSDRQVLSHYTKVYSMLRLVDSTLNSWTATMAQSPAAFFDIYHLFLSLIRKIKHG